jgi:thioredoxin-like negative regulator of GroEL
MDTENKCAAVDNNRDLDKLLKDREKVIALVYASWCPFCRRFLPVFEQYAGEEKRYFLLAQDDRETIADKYAIEIVPTLLFFEKGILSKRLDGEPGAGLNEKQLKEFIMSCSLPQS